MTKLLWVDVETSGLPDGNDYSGVKPLEIAFFLTDENYHQVSPVQSVVLGASNDEIALFSDFIKDLHGKNGLLNEVRKSKKTWYDAEQEVLDHLKEYAEREFLSNEQFILAGSGVSHFDLPLIRTHFPNLADRLAYFTEDIGSVRRFLKRTLGESRVPVVPDSSGDEKLHRAESDILAHLAEGRELRDYVRFYVLDEDQTKYRSIS